MLGGEDPVVWFSLWLGSILGILYFSVKIALSVLVKALQAMAVMHEHTSTMIDMLRDNQSDSDRKELVDEQED